MAKPSIAFRKTNKATKEFVQLLGKLSKNARRLVRVAAIEFDKDPTRKTFRFHQLKETSRGNHCEPTMTLSAVVLVAKGRDRFAASSGFAFAPSKVCP